MAAMNPFLSAQAAAHYARGRPYYHPEVIERIRELLALREPVPLAVDVACGTGLSTLALSAIAQRVIGLDTSAQMLAQAPRHAAITYEIAPAEALPLSEASVDIITVASAFHWLARVAFLAEVRRVLRPGGWLVIYDHNFMAEMEEEPAFAAYMREVYAGYPSPPRDRSPFTDEDAAAHGLRIASHIEYPDAHAFDLPSLVDYLLSQSNFTWAVDSGRITGDALRGWLSASLSPCLAGREHGTFRFRGDITCARRAPE
ncbi:MAG TPA: class I SAM-dependent methyltransferase [Ktedonobacterales bacterium]